MSEPKFKPGDHVTYHGNDFVIDDIIGKHERGYMYQFVGMPNFAVVESVLTGDVESACTPITKEEKCQTK